MLMLNQKSSPESTSKIGTALLSKHKFLGSHLQLSSWSSFTLTIYSRTVQRNRLVIQSMCYKVNHLHKIAKVQIIIIQRSKMAD